MSRKHIDECIRTSLDGYFRDLRGAEPHHLQKLIFDAVAYGQAQVFSDCWISKEDADGLLGAKSGGCLIKNGLLELNFSAQGAVWFVKFD